MDEPDFDGIEEISYAAWLKINASKWKGDHG